MARTKQYGLAPRAAFTVIAVLIGISLTACDDDDDDDLAAPINEELSTGRELGRDVAAELAAAIPQDADEATVIGNLAAVTEAINIGEIEQAEIALDRADRAAVLDLAAIILDDHEAALDASDELLARMEIGIIDNPASEQLTAAANEGIEELQNARDAAFDRRYLLTQIRIHAAADEVLERAILLAPPGDFEDYLIELEGIVEAHLFEAIDLADVIL